MFSFSNLCPRFSITCPEGVAGNYVIDIRQTSSIGDQLPSIDIGVLAVLILRIPIYIVIISILLRQGVPIRDSIAIGSRRRANLGFTAGVNITVVVLQGNLDQNGFVKEGEFSEIIACIIF